MSRSGPLAIRLHNDFDTEESSKGLLIRENASTREILREAVRKFRVGVSDTTDISDYAIILTIGPSEWILPDAPFGAIHRFMDAVKGYKMPPAPRDPLYVTQFSPDSYENARIFLTRKKKFVSIAVGHVSSVRDSSSSCRLGIDDSMSAKAVIQQAIVKMGLSFSVEQCNLWFIHDGITERCFDYLEHPSMTISYWRRRGQRENIRLVIRPRQVNPHGLVVLSTLGEVYPPPQPEDSPFRVKCKERKYLNSAWLACLRSFPANNQCADCTAPWPRFVSLNLGIFLCEDCAGIHMDLSTCSENSGHHQALPFWSKIRPMDFFNWSSDLFELFVLIGNARSNSLWERFLHRPQPDYDRAQFIAGEAIMKQAQPDNDQIAACLTPSQPELPILRGPPFPQYYDWVKPLPMAVLDIKRRFIINKYIFRRYSLDLSRAILPSRTPIEVLFRSIANANHALVAHLLAQGTSAFVKGVIDPNQQHPNKTSFFGQSPLHFSALRSNSPMSLLLTWAGCNPSARDNRQRSPLHFASAIKRKQTDFNTQLFRESQVLFDALEREFFDLEPVHDPSGHPALRADVRAACSLFLLHFGQPSEHLVQEFVSPEGRQIRLFLASIPDAGIQRLFASAVAEIEHRWSHRTEAEAAAANYSSDVAVLLSDAMNSDELLVAQMSDDHLPLLLDALTAEVTLREQASVYLRHIRAVGPRQHARPRPRQKPANRDSVAQAVSAWESRKSLSAEAIAAQSGTSVEHLQASMAGASFFVSAPAGHPGRPGHAFGAAATPDPEPAPSTSFSSVFRQAFSRKSSAISSEAGPAGVGSASTLGAKSRNAAGKSQANSTGPSTTSAGAGAGAGAGPGTGAGSGTELIFRTLGTGPGYSPVPSQWMEDLLNMQLAELSSISGVASELLLMSDISQDLLLSVDDRLGMDLVDQASNSRTVFVSGDPPTAGGMPTGGNSQGGSPASKQSFAVDMTQIINKQGGSSPGGRADSPISGMKPPPGQPPAHLRAGSLAHNGAPQLAPGPFQGTNRLSMMRSPTPLGPGEGGSSGGPGTAAALPGNSLHHTSFSPSRPSPGVHSQHQMHRFSASPALTGSFSSQPQPGPGGYSASASAYHAGQQAQAPQLPPSLLGNSTSSVGAPAAVTGTSSPANMGSSLYFIQQQQQQQQQQPGQHLPQHASAQLQPPAQYSAGLSTHPYPLHPPSPALPHHIHQHSNAMPVPHHPGHQQPQGSGSVPMSMFLPPSIVSSPPGQQALHPQPGPQAGLSRSTMSSSLSDFRGPAGLAPPAPGSGVYAGPPASALPPALQSNWQARTRASSIAGDLPSGRILPESQSPLSATALPPKLTAPPSQALAPAASYDQQTIDPRMHQQFQQQTHQQQAQHPFAHPHQHQHQRQQHHTHHSQPPSQQVPPPGAGHFPQPSPPAGALFSGAALPPPPPPATMHLPAAPGSTAAVRPPQHPPRVAGPGTSPAQPVAAASAVAAAAGSSVPHPVSAPVPTPASPLSTQSPVASPTGCPRREAERGLSAIVCEQLTPLTSQMVASLGNLPARVGPGTAGLPEGLHEASKRLLQATDGFLAELVRCGGSMACSMDPALAELGVALTKGAGEVAQAAGQLRVCFADTQPVTEADAFRVAVRGRLLLLMQAVRQALSLCS
ncbi:hypothetical protein H696_05154 [Fonticula alba]|uniref:Arf-GAP domain-containing protein n=1 Tax=Fonticula alba TaxID=691883 RepID=A0A058Z1T5_FONAL|nr:hypothetical protein H696_05154 [Fonticula alba]KCV68230.1 hypothetical protein H696_05154 [Fonticula alba]|eukprot:XP_009497284.1 hypothetical protein H696_05154 [Fonticula alba]